MKKSLLFALSGLGIFVASFLFVGCHRPHGHHGPDVEKIQSHIMDEVEDTMDELEVTDEQRQLIRGEIEALMTEMAPDVEEHRQTRKLFMEELLKDSPDVDKLHQLIDDKMRDIQSKLHRGLDTVVKIQRMLTPEQRSVLGQMIREHMAE